MVLTPEVGAAMNAEVASGAQAPYALFAMTEQDWLTLAGWQQDVLRYLRQLRAVVDFYRAGKDLPTMAAPAQGS
jgi:hypothetical protein